MLQIENLSFSYKKGHIILDDISLEVPNGEVLGILGPNGTGKTTFIKCINNILKPDIGKVLFDGENISKLSQREIAKIIAYVPQYINSFFAMNVIDAVMMGRLPYAGKRYSKEDEENLSIPKGVEVYEINGPYFFGIATKFEEIMSRLGDRPKVRIIRMRKVPFIDSTGIHNLTSLCQMAQREKTTIVLSGVNEKVHKALEKSGFYELLGEKNICPNINVALERAKELLNQ